MMMPCPYTNPVLQVGHSNRALLGHFSRAPKPLQKAKQQLDEMIPRVQQVMKQTRERVLKLPGPP